MGFLACRVFNDGQKVTHRLVKDLEIADLTAGDTQIKVDYSSVNYKDALAATGRGKILKTFPLNAGIDLAGEIICSDNPALSPGQQVLVNGCGLGEQFDGGLAQIARVESDWVIPMPDGLDARSAMALGTAGFTAALALHRMEQNNQSPDKGPVVVTGASGGVGSVAVDLLSSKGYEVIAVTSRESYFDYLKSIGAHQAVTAEQLNLGHRALEKARFGGVIDNVGGALLSQLIAQVHLWGNVASIGMAMGAELSATVFPFILRGVSLLGVSSTNCPMPLRRQVWQRLGQDLKPQHLDKIISDTVPLADISQVFEQLLERQRYGRVIIDCR